MASNYTPIDCDQHDILELAIMQGGKLRVRFDGETDSHLITPLELSTREGEEFLRYRGTGGVHEVRLDRLKELGQDQDEESQSASRSTRPGSMSAPTKQ